MTSIFESIKQFNKVSEGDKIEKDEYVTNTNFGNNVYHLFDHLLELFTKLNLISSDPKDNVSKFRFIHAFPDSIHDDGCNVLTYNIVRRTSRVTQNHSVNTRNVTKYKPTFVAESYNDITGNVDSIYKLEFDNVISITAFSSKARTLNNMARLIEGIMLKYSSYIKQVVDEVVYIGTSDITYLNRYDEQSPIYSRELQFKVLTTEVFKQELEHIKSIDLQLK